MTNSSFRQRQLLSMLVLMFLPLAVVTAFALPNIRTIIIRSTQSQLETIADLKTAQLYQWLKQGQYVTQLVASQPEIQTSAASCLQTQDSSLQNLKTDLRHRLQTIAAIHPSIKTIAIIHPETGQLLVSTDSLLTEKNYQTEPFFTYGQKELYISPLAYSVGQQSSSMVISMPIKQNKTLIGVVAVEMNLDDLQTALSSRSGLGKTGRVYLVDAYGYYVTLLAYSDGHPIQTVVESEGVRRARARGNGSAMYYDTNGVPVLGVYRWLPEGNISLLVELTQTELSGQINLMWKILLIAALCVGIIGIFPAIYFSNKLVTPLEAITRAAHALHSGNFSYRAPTKGTKEIKQLAITFNRMAASLQQSYQYLEQQVALRTAELQKEIAERQRIEDALRQGEAQYRYLFENSPVSLWVEDYSAVKKHLNHLKQQGITNFNDFFLTNPEVLTHCVTLVKVLDVNQITLNLYEATSKEDLSGGLNKIFTPEAFKRFGDQLTAMANNAFNWEGYTINRTLTGQEKNLLLRWSVAPGYEDSFARIFVSIIDVTGQVQATIERERLLENERHQRLIAETLTEVTLALTAQTSPDILFDEILRQVKRLVPYNSANITLVEGENLRVVRWKGYNTFGTEAFIKTQVYPINSLPLEAMVIKTQQPQVLADVRLNPDWVGFEATAWIRSYMSVPICQRNKTLGLLRLDGAITGQFTAEDARRLQPIAAAAAITLENTRLYKQAQQDAQTKSILLDEVNHRVKNNLSAIVGLLYTERRHLTTTAQPNYRTIIDDLIQRVQGLASVHTMLSAAEWHPLRLYDLTQTIINSALKQLSSSRNSKITITPAEVLVSARQANSLALLLNELATNSIKYTPEKTIILNVIIKNDANQVTLTFQDNGPGYPEAILQNQNWSVGLHLIHSIAHHDLNGTVTLANNATGASTTIQFKPS